MFKVAAPARPDADGPFIMFGVATFAVLLPLALLLYRPRRQRKRSTVWPRS